MSTVRALSEAEIVGLYGCEADLAGDLVTWSPARWSLEEGAASANTDYRSLCLKTFQDEVIVVPDAVTFDQADFMCGFLSGGGRVSSLCPEYHGQW